MKSFIAKNKWWLLAITAIMAALVMIRLGIEKKTETKLMVSECVRGGCSGQLCLESGNETGVSTCEWKDVYQCYQKAVCEKQTNGKCGFTQSPEFQQCLSKFGDSIDSSILKSR